MDKKEIKRSCVDCGVGNCNQMDKSYPQFCLSTGLAEEDLASVLEKYEGEELRAAQIAAEVENDHYCQMTRVQEVAEFAKKMGYRKIGIATCVGHDSLFYRHSDALVTTLVAKDRVLGHNTVAALQMADGYYAKKLFGDQK